MPPHPLFNTRAGGGTHACAVSTLSTEPSSQSNSTLLLNRDHEFEMLAYHLLRKVHLLLQEFFLLFHSFNTCLSNTYKIPGPLLRAGSTRLKKRHMSSAGL